MAKQTLRLHRHEQVAQAQGEIHKGTKEAVGYLLVQEKKLT